MKKLQVETAAYVFTDIQFLDGQILPLFQKWLEVPQA